jgi:hypothetical protein
LLNTWPFADNFTVIDLEFDVIIVLKCTLHVFNCFEFVEIWVACRHTWLIFHWDFQGMCFLDVAIEYSVSINWRVILLNSSISFLNFDFLSINYLENRTKITHFRCGFSHFILWFHQFFSSYIFVSICYLYEGVSL